MKKNILNIVNLLVLLFLYSCSNEQPNEANQNTSSTAEVIKPPTSSTEMNPPTIKSASFEIGPYGGLGYGYDVTGEYANALSSRHQVINITQFVKDEPNRFDDGKVFSSEYSHMYAENAMVFSDYLSRRLEITNGKNMFGKTLSANFSNSMTNNNKFEAKYVYAKAYHTIRYTRFRINPGVDQLLNYLTPEFLKSIDSKTPQQIVNEYGTHVMVDIYTGAKFEALYQAETTDPDREQATSEGIDLAMRAIFSALPLSFDNPEANKNFNQRLSFRTIGGDPSKSLIGYLNLDQPNPKIDTSNWLNTVDENNSYLVDFDDNGLIYLYDLVADPTKKAALKAYINQYLIDNKVTLK